ncbi:MAG: hypothetical protein K0S86_4456, partial [Geminicoccaceae bacterium]|nr:hypothetical protein [Geminicoccaceae bacterium]
MQIAPHRSRRGRDRRLVRLISASALVGLSSVVNGCRDASELSLAPASPAPSLSGDGVWVVNSLADPGDGECASNECTLR